MKKIIYTKTIELLVINGIMLAFLTFKERLTWDWILIYSCWLIFFHPVLLTYLPTSFVTTLVNSIPRLDQNSGVLPYKSSSGIA